MKLKRPLLLVASASMVLLLLGGGLAAKVGVSDSPYRQSALFAEVLQLILDNYVDPVESGELLSGAYEGMLGGVDAHGAFLTADELKAWRAERPRNPGDPGCSVLKSGSGLQVVALDPGSPADTAGVKIGDQILNVLDSNGSVVCNREHG